MTEESELDFLQKQNLLFSSQLPNQLGAHPAYVMGTGDSLPMGKAHEA
jgi:hypothetical protein